MASPVSPGDILAAKFAVERVIGQGGMGVVVAARHLALDERVALKLLPASDEPPDERARRLRREARAAARLRSKHAVRVSDIGQLDDGSPFLVMEYIEGRALSEVVRQGGPLPSHEAVDLILQACDAVAEAHSLGIVHRDLKPSNLMLSRLPDGSPWLYVLDFGIAKIQGASPGGTLTRTSAVLGSPTYMSPEQIRDAHRVDERTDQWSLGVTLYELLSGALPFAGGSTAAVLASIAADPPVPLSRACPGLPRGLADAVMRCLSKDPSGRHASVAALAAALEPFGSAASSGSGARIARVLQSAPSREPVRGHEAPPDDETRSRNAPDETRGSQGAMATTHTAFNPRPAPAAAPTPAWRLAPLALLAVLAGGGLLRAWSPSQAASPAPSVAPQAPLAQNSAPAATSDAQAPAPQASAPQGVPSAPGAPAPQASPAVAAPTPRRGNPPDAGAPPTPAVQVIPTPRAAATTTPATRQAAQPTTPHVDLPEYGARK